MSTSGRGGGRNAKGKGRGQGRSGRGNNYSGATAIKKPKGQTAALGDHVFDYGQKGSADQTKTTYEAIVLHSSTVFTTDIGSELENRKRLVIPTPEYSQEALDAHAALIKLRDDQYKRMAKARNAQLTALKKEGGEGAAMRQAILEGEIAMADHESTLTLPITLEGDEKIQHANAWRTYRERVSSLEKHRGQAFSMIRGQCTQILLDKMKYDPEWDDVSASYDPTKLINMIERIVLGQTEDQYPYATVYDQVCSMYAFQQNELPNPTYYERFNTKVAIGVSVGVTHQHPVLLEHTTAELHPGRKYADLAPDEATKIQEVTEERYLAFLLIRSSGKQHSKLRMDLQNDFTTGDDHYPKNRQAALHLLDKYSKTVVVKPAPNEGNSFAQGGGKGKEGKHGGKKEPYDKEFFKDKECRYCKKLGHPADHCFRKKRDEAAAKGDKTKDDKSKPSKAESITQLQNNMKKSFATFQKSIDKLNAEDKAEEESEEEAQGHLQFTFAQSFETRNKAALFKQHDSKFDKLNLRNIILLDNQSTMDLFCNPTMVQDIVQSTETLTVTSNGGSMKVNQKATVRGYNQQVWFSTDAITNIISLSNLTSQYRVTYDSEDAQKFVIHREGKPNMEFRKHSTGLHFYNPTHDDMVFVATVASNETNYTERQRQGAARAKDLYERLAYPSIKDFKWAVMSNQIMDCPITVDDVNVAHALWGKNIAALKGKTTRKKTIPVATSTMPVPPGLLNLHKDVTLTADVFFVNKIPFFLSLSRKICYTAVTDLVNRQVPTIFEAFKQVFRLYKTRGFQTKYLLVDGEFAPLKDMIEGLPGGPTVNLATANEHVPEIERRIRVVKERVRALRLGLPFSRLCKMLIVHLVFYATQMINCFPVSVGISKTVSPMTLMTGQPLNYKRHLALAFGQYCQVHEEELPRNSLLPRTRGAICLGPTGNLQGGYKFMALDTGKRITRRSWDAIPMPDTVIARVNELGKGQPQQLVFTDRHGRLIGDVQIAGVDGDDTSLVDELEPDDDPEIITPPEDPLGEVRPQPLEAAETISEIAPLQDYAPEEAPAVPTQAAPPDEIPGVEPQVGPHQGVPSQNEGPTEIPGVRRSSRVKIQAREPYVPSMTGSKYALASAQLHDYGVLHPDTHLLFCQCAIAEEPDVVAAIMTQLSLKAGMKEWGKVAEQAVLSEMKQLHMRDTFRPMHWRELNDLQKKTILESHMFLKQKRDGKIKGRTVAGGNKQRDFISKEDSSSPTVSTEAVLLTCIIDAEEGRDVAVIDIPNAFIQTRIEDEKDMAILKIRGVLVDMLLQVAPDVYGPYVTTDKKGVKQVIVQSQNAIYGTMVASLLFYFKLRKTLTRNKFVINPYDLCVFNRTVNGKQQTLCAHVDDCKLSCIDVKLQDEFIEILRQEYESIFEDGSGAMQVSRGKVHTYLGMQLDFTVPGQVKVSMFGYVQEILDVFDQAEPDGSGIKTSAAPSDLYKVDESCEKLAADKKEQFHSLVAKTLFATKRARPDTCTPISFLTTRVREPDLQDWSKMSHLMKYLRGTKDMPLILSADGSGILKWWVDGSFAVHPDMRGHTGGGLSMGRGFPIVTSTRQKLNTRSSTESELVAVDDCMPSILWTRYFMQAQGYGITENIVFQDNKSAILLEKNGRASSSKRTKHINVRFYFVTDRIAKGDLTVSWCPTDDMTGDFMTKPNQGALFKKFRDQLMGVVKAEDPGPGKLKARMQTNVV